MSVAHGCIGRGPIRWRRKMPQLESRSGFAPERQHRLITTLAPSSRTPSFFTLALASLHHIPSGQRTLIRSLQAVRRRSSTASSSPLSLYICRSSHDSLPSLLLGQYPDSLPAMHLPKVVKSFIVFDALLLATGILLIGAGSVWQNQVTSPPSKESVARLLLLEGCPLVGWLRPISVDSSF